MSTSLHALLGGIVDYAGLFPPAALPLDQAIRNYAQYRHSADRWMLGRFVVPAARLHELNAFDNLFQAPPFAFSVLGRGGKSAGEFHDGLRADVAAVHEFRQRHAGRVVVDALEVKLPADLIGGALDKTLELVPAALMPYFEIDFGADWRKTLDGALTALGAAARRRPLGFKLRCGGLEAAAFPTIEQVAAVIIGCRDREVPFKATAGLHHAVRRFNAALQTHMHGFVNVFGGAVLAASRGLDEGLVAMILGDEEPGHFCFSDEGFSWGKTWTHVDAIRISRERLAIAFGSCSFEEPCQEARALEG